MAIITPVKPPTVNRATAEMAYSIGVSKVMLPRHIVANQLKIFTPVGIAINMVEYIKNNSPESGIPTVYM